MTQPTLRSMPMVGWNLNSGGFGSLLYTSITFPSLSTATETSFGLCGGPTWRREKTCRLPKPAGLTMSRSPVDKETDGPLDWRIGMRRSRSIFQRCCISLPSGVSAMPHCSSLSLLSARSRSELCTKKGSKSLTCESYSFMEACSNFCFSLMSSSRFFRRILRSSSLFRRWWSDCSMVERCTRKMDSSCCCNDFSSTWRSARQEAPSPSCCLTLWSKEASVRFNKREAWPPKLWMVFPSVAAFSQRAMRLLTFFNSSACSSSHAEAGAAPAAALAAAGGSPEASALPSSPAAAMAPRGLSSAG
mmetsp:Transcript_68626/g.189940  ORF Transcript_68626/g.189940 Transcript_68626/m.189940 type:complete len:303 (-) Transcript_68626:78-986(-)